VAKNKPVEVKRRMEGSLGKMSGGSVSSSIVTSFDWADGNWWLSKGRDVLEVNVIMWFMPN
jgi:hypothetical protein